ncbi:cystatin-SN-like [Alligator sinensis]|uniref:Egg-white cystatin n=1 Tax=Alligator sinensis TaxID=38654 RepID=A0A3Q0H788_ALLSI|nr:cystatin-SN-like [Alligator sinensis]
MGRYVILLWSQKGRRLCGLTLHNASYQKHHEIVGPPALKGVPKALAERTASNKRGTQWLWSTVQNVCRQLLTGEESFHIPVRSSLHPKIVSGIKYILDVELGRTTCTKSATDLQSCAFHKEPAMAKHVTCNFVVLSVPWLNQISLLKNNCQ